MAAQIVGDQPNEATLHVSRLDPGDEVAFEIRHRKAKAPPQLKGEIRGAPESFTQGLTLAQRLATLLPVLYLLSLQYLGLSDIVWLIDLRTATGGSGEEILFILASPLVQIVTALLLYRAAIIRPSAERYRPSDKRHRTARVLKLANWVYRPHKILKLSSWISNSSLALLPLALLVAWHTGYRLWYPQFVIFAGVLWLLVRVVTRQSFSSTFGLSGSARRGSFPLLLVATAILVDAIGSVVFAWAVAAGATSSTLIFIGLLYALAYAISRMDIDWLRRRLPSALGNPRGRFLEPPRGNPQDASPDDRSPQLDDDE